MLLDSKFFVYGSLSARSCISCKTLFQLLEIAPYKVLDINLCPPHFNRKIVEDILQNADLFKLNLSELELITGWFLKFHSEADRIRILQDKFQLQNIIVTKGSAGSLLNVNGHLYEHHGFTVEVADMAGSGDAFLAGMIFKLIDSAPIKEAQVFAGAIGALVASRPGSCPEYSLEEIYKINSDHNNITSPIHNK